MVNKKGFKGIRIVLTICMVFVDNRVENNNTTQLCFIPIFELKDDLMVYFTNFGLEL